mgnify:CR=1 FL=1|tara:strand:- start:3089 stop:3874 length:786 start_codon:yes stop_codon:yes gene_type:complete
MGNRLGVIGYGFIGSSVVDKLLEDSMGFDLIGIADIKEIKNPPVPQIEVDRLIEMCDVILEAGGHSVVDKYAVQILSSGLTLVIVSTGALSDPILEKKVMNVGTGDLVLCNGAIGGVDYLQSVGIMGGIESVCLTSTKRPGVLIQPWMDMDLKEKLKREESKVIVFEGNAREAAKAFPKSTNVSATIAMTIGDWDKVKIRIVADPRASNTTHQIEVFGEAGVSKFEVANLPSTQSPATSGIVPFSVLKTLRNLSDKSLRII